MKLTKRGEYALRTMIRLGVAHKLGREVVSVSQLAEAERVPFKFLEQILGDLREAGYVESKRGKHGGCFLAKPMDQMKMGELVRLIDGRLAPIGCASETDYEKCTCPDEAHCGLRMIMIDVRNAIANILDRYTLGNVVEVTLRKILRDGSPLPFGVPEIPDPPRPDVRRADPADGFLKLLTDTLTLPI
jgi:Rrf2 family protein